MKVRAAIVFFVVTVYVVAANIPSWIASRSMGLLLNGVFNFELVVLGILSVFLRRSVTLTLLGIAMVLDVLWGISSTYLLSPSEMIRSAILESLATQSEQASRCLGITVILRVFSSAEGARRGIGAMPLASLITPKQTLSIHKRAGYEPEMRVELTNGTSFCRICRAYSGPLST